VVCIQLSRYLKEGGILKIAGVLLIIAGVAALIYGGFTFTSQKKAVDMGPIQIDKTEHHTVPLPPLLGVVAILGGGALFYFGVKEGK
jgi:drug/metabolite transporter (DMT)-like permease